MRFHFGPLWGQSLTRLLDFIVDWEWTVHQESLENSNVTYCMLFDCVHYTKISCMKKPKGNAPIEILRVFADNVRNYRMKMGISQEAFAEKCGLHRTYISAVECYRRSIALENVQRIADALEIDVYKLFIEENSGK